MPPENQQTYTQSTSPTFVPSAPVTPPPTPPTPPPRSSSGLMVGIVVGFLVAAVAGGAYFFLAWEADVDSPPVGATQPETNSVRTDNESQQGINDLGLNAAFLTNLNSCTPYKGTFIHPLTAGETMTREILGIIGGKCNYVEQMPNGGKMECKYTDKQRVAIAQYYKDSAVATTYETSSSIDMDGNQETITKMDGKVVVVNPLQDALEDGTCVISGY